MEVKIKSKSTLFLNIIAKYILVYAAVAQWESTPLKSLGILIASFDQTFPKILKRWGRLFNPGLRHYERRLKKSRCIRATFRSRSKARSVKALPKSYFIGV